jgi:ABC-2 type transport system ATP-binding protein
MAEYAVVEIAGLVKSFGRTQALAGLDLLVAPGEVHGFLGPHGAGTTTTIRILLGLLRADAGHLRLLGGDPWNGAVPLHRRLAYVPGEVNLWPKLTGGQVIDALARLRRDLDDRRRQDLLERFELDPTKRTGSYSKGNRQKVALVAALASRAELLILDEPTSGLDPLMEAVFQDCVREVKAEGRTVLLSSHILAEVEALCDRVTIVRAGRAVRSGTLTQLRSRSRTSVAAVTERPATPLTALPGVESLHLDGAHATFTVDDENLESAMRILIDHGLRSVTSQPPTLEELFLSSYDEPGNGRSARPAAAVGAAGREAGATR